jgi:gliding motility-associated-like protein
MKKLFALLFCFTCLVSVRGQWVSTVAGVLETPGFNDGVPLSARFYNPHGIAVDSTGTVYIADRYNHTIRKFSPNDNTVTTLAGKAGQTGATDGVGSTARFNEPWGLCVSPGGVVYVADTKNNKIRKVMPDGTVSTVAGTGNYGTTNGAGAVSTFGNPTGIEIDANGNLYVADHLTHIIRKITPNGLVTTLAGFPYIPGDEDGTGADAQFWRPYGLTLDNQGNILVADEWNHKIRKVTPAGVVTTVAGIGTVGIANGPLDEATFNYPWDMTVDAAGNIYVADGYNYVIRKISPDGSVSSLAGKPQLSGGVDGEGADASFSGATAVAYCSKTNSLYVGDAYNHLIRNITLNGQQPTPTVSVSSTGGKTNFCEGNQIQIKASPANYSIYRFYLNGSLVQESSSPNFSTDLLEIGTHTITLEADFLGETLLSNIITINVFPIPEPTISAVGPLNFFEGDSVVLLAIGTGSFHWSNGATGQAITVFNSGIFYVEETQNGCTGLSEDVVVDVTDLPDTVSVQVDGGTVLCPGKTTRLISSANTGNQWMKDGWAIPGATGQTLAVWQPGQYQVQVTDPQTNISTLSQPVVIDISAPIDFGFEATPRQARVGDEIKLKVTGASQLVNFTWDFGNPDAGSENVSTLAQPSVYYDAPGNYTIRLAVVNAAGCRDTLTKPNYIQIFEEDVAQDLFIPTAFTPNGDGNNDIFRVRGRLTGNFYMGVFNQWGEEIFVSQNADTGWDGTRNGQPVHSGTYVYLVKLNTPGGPKQLTGHITLLR